MEEMTWDKVMGTLMDIKGQTEADMVSLNITQKEGQIITLTLMDSDSLEDAKE